MKAPDECRKFERKMLNVEKIEKGENIDIHRRESLFKFMKDQIRLVIKEIERFLMSVKVLQIGKERISEKARKKN